MSEPTEDINPLDVPITPPEKVTKSGIKKLIEFFKKPEEPFSKDIKQIETPEEPPSQEEKGIEDDEDRDESDEEDDDDDDD